MGKILEIRLSSRAEVAPWFTRQAGLARTYLHEKFKRLQIDPTDYRG